MSALFRRKKKTEQVPELDPGAPLVPQQAPFDGSQTTYITGDRERDSGRVRLLIDSLRDVSTETDPDELLVTMVDRAVQTVRAERGLLFVQGEDGQPQVKVARAANGSDLEDDRSWSSREVLGVLEGGEPVCKRADDGADFDPSQSMINLNIRSVMCVPLSLRDHIVGAIYVDARASERPFAKGDLRFFEAFADMLSIVWTNRQVVEERLEKERMERDLELAREIQGSLVPAHGLQDRGFTLCGKVIPASEAGGDYYDFFKMHGDRLAMVVGDVSGHGAGPALFMSGARAYLRAHCQTAEAPSDILSRLNDHLTGDMGDDMFMSMFFCVVDPAARQISYANAGHPNPIFVRGGQVQEYRRTGMALGVEEDMDWGQVGPETLEPGDTLVIFTDGIIEMRQGDTLYGRDRLAESVVRNADKSAQEIVDAIIQDAVSWAGLTGAAEDDLTVAVLRADG